MTISGEESFETVLRLSTKPPACPKCGAPGEWQRWGINDRVVHWWCSLEIACAWGGYLRANGDFHQGLLAVNR